MSNIITMEQLQAEVEELRAKVKNRRPHVLHIERITHKNRYGKVLWEDGNIDNIFHDEGEKYLCARTFATGMAGYYGTTAANLYLGLDARSSLAEADTLASLSGEPSGNNYARIALSTAGTGLSGQDFYINQPSAAYGAESKIVTFTCATSAWPAVTKMFLCTVASGTSGLLLCSLALSTTRILQIGDSLNASMNVYLSE